MSNVVGNVYDKYGTSNPIARRLMQGFLEAVTSLYDIANPQRVLEVGCGEGKLAQQLLEHQRARGTAPHFEACDLELDRLVPDLDPAIQTREASIYALPWADDAFDLVVCCEVLEHLEDPAAGLAELARVSARFVLLSTPWEPTWRLLNLARLRYVRDLGNTPGHLQHFSRRGLLQLAQTELRVVDERTPLPWTVLLGRVP